MSPGSSWERLVRLARQAPPVHPGGPPPGWTRITARTALRTAALAPPPWWRLLLARLGGPGALLSLVVVLTGSGLLAVWLLHPGAGGRAGQRYQAWSAESLRQLKQWYPLSCDDAGELHLLLDRTLIELRNAGAPDGSNAVALITNAQHRIAARLTPAEREQFAKQQAELVQRHLGWPPPGQPPPARRP